MEACLTPDYQIVSIISEQNETVLRNSTHLSEMLPSVHSSALVLN